ncbi:MerR family transcriptional regulator [Nocardiopsis potens]|uniref:MerR family transcriptional regulator n=1 Tax=Nocardiopsis potens TaxID=1246458 RepID=UPI0004776305|nr:MerR family transcriptional regulator [Nocardiopsis potens]
MRIGELAGRTGASVRSLRYYEEQGLLASDRTPSGQRVYGEYAVERVLLLRSLYDAGLTSSAIAEVLPCVDSPGSMETDAAWRRMAAERERIDARIKDLVRTRDALDGLIAVNRRHRESLAG